MRIVVTGGAGFIGSHIVDALVVRGDTPIVIDDLSGGNVNYLPSGVELIAHDIADPNVIDIVSYLRPDGIVHAAAQVSVPFSMMNSQRDREINLVGTSHIIEGGKQGGASRFVLLSTGGAIYGETSQPATEAILPKPKSYYGIHKYAAERYVELSGLGYGIARLANVYGPRQRSNLEGGVVAIFAERLLRREPIHVYGTGEQTRDLIHVSDVARAILCMLDSSSSGTWNVSTGTDISINGLLNVMEEIIAPAAAIHYFQERNGDVLHSCLSAEAIFRDLEWKPELTIADGVRTLIPADAFKS